MELNWKLFLISCFSVALCLVVELSAKNELQDSSADYIYSLQKDRTKGSDYFFIIVSEASEYVAMVIGFVFYLVSRSKAGLMCIYVTFFVTWLGDVLKMAIAHPRPFWYDSRIDAIMCSKDYGSPSGHAGTVGGLIIFIYWINIQRNLIVTTSIATVSLGLLALDRNYLGLHFYFQVVLGYSIAFFTVSSVMLPRFWSFIELASKDLKKTLIFQSTLACLLGLGVIIYFTRDPEMLGKWKDNYEDECHGKLFKEKALFSSLLESSCLMIAAGVSFGCFLNKFEVVKNWKYSGASLTVFVVGGVIEQICEKYCKALSEPASFSLFCVLRFLIGVYVTAFIPFVLSFCFNNNQKEDSSTIPLIRL